MRVLPLETGITYGPLFSRRLGLSLGVNLLPTGYKLCSFDCVYCHYGRTEVKTLAPPPRDFPWTRDVLRAIEAARNPKGFLKPLGFMELARIVEGLKGVPNLIIQSVLIDGQVSNIRGKAFEAWVETLADVRPARVQIYSGRTISVRTDYPVPEAGVERVLPYVLRRIAGEVERRAGVQVDAYWM